MEEVRLHGPHGAAKDARDLFVRQVMIDAKDDRGTLFRGSREIAAPARRNAHSSQQFLGWILRPLIEVGRASIGPVGGRFVPDARLRHTFTRSGRSRCSTTTGRGSASAPYARNFEDILGKIAGVPWLPTKR
jgi:hypothetical protein